MPVYIREKIKIGSPSKRMNFCEDAKFLWTHDNIDFHEISYSVFYFVHKNGINSVFGKV